MKDCYTCAYLNGAGFCSRTACTYLSENYLVPVIRCKDCKHWDGYYCHNKWWGDGYGNYTPPIKKEDGYCDWAERKEE